jgi:SAM-dependent methyltransferase
MALYRYQQDPVDLPGVAVAALADCGMPGDVVVDVGTGTGVYAERLRRERPELRVVAVDRSPAMVADVLGDAERLPLAGGCAAAALAMHMLYHVPRIPAAVAELRRVVRLGGVVVVSTNGPGDKPELDTLWRSALHDLTGTDPEPLRQPHDRFGLDHGPLLGAAFAHVTLERFDRVTLVPGPEPVRAYVDSLRAWKEPDLPPGVTWDAFLAAADRHVAEVLARQGAFALSSRTGVFVCR